jgi:glutamate synthase (NADPH/NADH) small chain
MRELPGTEFEMEVELVLLAMGFLGPERNTVLAQLGVAITDRGTVAVDASKMTSVRGVFAAGDTARGQSLVVWAITEGRQAAKGIDAYLMGSTTLP